MKKLVIFLIFLLCISGCTKKEETETIVKEETENVIEEEDADDFKVWSSVFLLRENSTMSA